MARDRPRAPSFLSEFLRNAIESTTRPRVTGGRCVECRGDDADHECETCGAALHRECDDAHGCDDDDDETEDAIEEYTAFHWGNQPDEIQTVTIPDPPKALVAIGKLEGVIYRTAKGKRRQESWVHMHDEADLPTLAYDPKTHQLYILGGKYRITKRGIED